MPMMQLKINMVNLKTNLSQFIKDSIKLFLPILMILKMKKLMNILLLHVNFVLMVENFQQFQVLKVILI